MLTMFCGRWQLWSNLWFSVWPKDALTCEQEEVGVELPTPWSEDDPPYFQSHSCHYVLIFQSRNRPGLKRVPLPFSSTHHKWYLDVQNFLAFIKQKQQQTKNVPCRVDFRLYLRRFTVSHHGLNKMCLCLELMMCSILVHTVFPRVQLVFFFFPEKRKTFCHDLLCNRISSPITKVLHVTW